MSFSSAPSYLEGYQITSKLHNSLRHPARIRILRDLADGPKPAILLAANHHLSSSTRCEHLRFLLDLSIVGFKRMVIRQFINSNQKVFPAGIWKA